MSVITCHSFAFNIFIFIVLMNVMKLSKLCIASPSKDSGPIIFPDRLGTLSQRFDEGNTPRRFIADVSRCAVNNQTFCTEAENYPLAAIQRILEKKGNELNNVFSNDIIPFIDVGNRDDSDGIDFCDTYRDVYYPQSAKNKDGVALFIINTATHKQGVNISMCRGEGKPCRSIVSVPNTYRAACIQQYVYYELITISPDGENYAKEKFPFPACCSCAAFRN